MKKLEAKIEKLEEKRKIVLEKYEKVQANLNKLQTELDNYDDEIKKCQDELSIIEMKDLITVMNTKGLKLNDLQTALLKGDLSELQEKLNDNTQPNQFQPNNLQQNNF